MTIKQFKDYPHLLAELDMSKNQDLTYKGNPINVLKLSAGTAKKLDWKCSTCEHEWKRTGNGRVSGHGCPACSGRVVHSDGRNSMSNTHPQLAKEYQGYSNLILAGTHTKLDWKCNTCEHEWITAGYHRVLGTGCPACVNQVLNNFDGRNSMAMTHPQVAIEYQGDANLIIAGTNKKISWKCVVCQHGWKATSNSRVTNGNGCPACANQVVNNFDSRNSMIHTHPLLAKEYQGDANLITAGTGNKLDWKCSTCEHEWKSSGSGRTGPRYRGCPACANQAIHIDGRNSMANTHPQLAKEYQGDANLIVAGIHKRIDWKCNTCEHEWRASGGGRSGSRETGCPACANQVVNNFDGRNSMAMTHPQLVQEYQGDANLVIAGTNQKLDWKCSICYHIWNVSGSGRVNSGRANSETGCPACINIVVNNYDGRNSMANTHPQLAKEYQGDANLIIAGTHVKSVWKCSVCDYEWKSQGANRCSGHGCPACAKTGYDSSKIGYVYILHYDDGVDNWLKCGITNTPIKRFSRLTRTASRVNIGVQPLDIYTFDDGWVAQTCEQELLTTLELRFNSEYDIDGKAEFFKYNALDEIKGIINKYQPN